MIKEQITHKTPTEHLEYIRQFHEPKIHEVIHKANSVKEPYKGTIQDYQAAWLYVLAKQYNKNKSIVNILEIGTGKGYSTSYLAMACPQANITSLSVRADEQREALDAINKLELSNVQFITVESSWKYLEEIKFSFDEYKFKYDFIFVDGDHNKVKKDLAYWDYLADNGLFLFHDYCPTFASNPQPIVYSELNAFKDKLPRTEFDILVTDNVDIGMCGLYK